MNARAQRYAALLASSAPLRAFLRVIREGETNQTDTAYRMVVGGALLDSLDAHPRRLVRIERYNLSSTAAGAYQFLARTWDECAAALGLTDFGPAAQDAACVFLIERRKALDDVLAGRVREAIAKCAREWASLPGSPYGQTTLTMARALAVYERYLGAAAPAPTPTPTPTPQSAPRSSPAPAPGPATASPAAPPTPTEEASMGLPLLPALAGALLQVFTPLAREKLSKEMNRHTDNPEVADKVADGLIQAAKTVTGLDDPVQAVAEVRKDPELAQRTEQLSLEQLGGLLAVVERMAKIDEASIAAARQFSSDEDWMVRFTWVRLKFIHVLSLTFVSFAGWFVVRTWDTLTPELRGAVITLMVIAGWNGVRDFWMGSSDGSQRKTSELLKRSKPE